MHLSCETPWRCLRIRGDLQPLPAEDPLQRRRLSASHAAAEKYIAQFPSPLVSHVARLVAFVAGSFAALALGAAVVEDFLLERRLGGRTLVWCPPPPRWAVWRRH